MTAGLQPHGSQPLLRDHLADAHQKEVSRTAIRKHDINHVSVARCVLYISLYTSRSRLPPRFLTYLRNFLIFSIFLLLFLFFISFFLTVRYVYVFLFLIYFLSISLLYYVVLFPSRFHFRSFLYLSLSTPFCIINYCFISSAFLFPAFSISLYLYY
jgi:hypothetical protein